MKAINGGSWQFSADTFLNIEVVNGQQVINGTKKLLNPKLLCIFVLLIGRGKDEFYLFHLSDLQKHCVKVYKPRGQSSKNPDSRHCAVSPKEFSRFKENWKLLESALQPWQISGFRGGVNDPDHFGRRFSQGQGWRNP